MAALKFLVQVFLVATLSTASVTSLNCYACNSANDPDCAASPPPEKYLLECSHDTLEILNDFHVHRPLESSPSKVANSTTAGPGQGPAVAGQKGNTSTTASFDKSDKDFVLDNDKQPQRTKRELTEEGIKKNGTTSGVSANPISLPKEATFCRKFEYHLPRQINGPSSKLEAQVRIRRACGWIPEDKNADGSLEQECKWIGQDGIQILQCVCTGDGCNSGRQLQSLYLHTLLLLVMMTFGYFYVL